MNRCSWVNDNPLYIEYHDKEWGRASYDDRHLFEMLILEMFQAGLSWECILNKRKYFVEAFDSFDVVKVSNYGDNKIEELMNNKNIVRNKRKITASISNAKIFREIQNEFGSFSNYIWSFTNNLIIDHKGLFMTSNELSDTISLDLKKRGMKFVGTVIIYSYLQAIGIINDHEIDCFCYLDVKKPKE